MHAAAAARAAELCDESRARAAAAREQLDVLAVTGTQRTAADNAANDSNGDGGGGLGALRSCAESVRRRVAALSDDIASAEAERATLQTQLASYAAELAVADAAASAEDREGANRNGGGTGSDDSDNTSKTRQRSSPMLRAVAAQPSYASTHVVALQTEVAALTRYISQQRAAFAELHAQELLLAPRDEQLADADDSDGRPDTPMSATDAARVLHAYDAEVAQMAATLAAARKRERALAAECAVTQRDIDALRQQKQDIKRRMNLSR